VAVDDAYPTPASFLTTMAQWEAFFTGMSASGVVPGVGSNLSPSLNAGSRTVNIAAGAAMVRGFYVPAPSSTSIAIPAADSQNRIDRLVLRLDRTAVTAADWVQPVILEGTPSGSPTAPALTHSAAGDWDLPICRWTSASNGNVTSLQDERYSIGSDVLVFHSGQKPQPDPAESCFGVEWDTSRPVWFNKSTATWNSLADDTGWVPFTVEGNWAPDGANLLRVRRINGVIHMRGVVNRTGSTLSAADDDDAVANLPVGFRPANWHYYSTWLFPDACLMRVGTDGEIRLRTHSSDVPVGRALYLSTTFMIA
jgi:hypothetical protein